jgi:hypothetical protein
MIGNLSRVETRLKMYQPLADKKFEVRSGLTPSEEAVKQQVRQYWSDKTIPDTKKLEGLNLDLSGFNPRRTTNRQLIEVTAFLADQGLIDSDLAQSISSMNMALDAQGNPLTQDREIDAYDFLTSKLARLSGESFNDNELAKGERIEVNAALSVLLALEQHAKAPREKPLVNIRI